MAGTYTQIYIQIVFAVRGREKLIPMNHKDELCKYITGIITNKGQKPIIVNGVTDHIHILVGLKPTMNISELTRDIKNNSSKYINSQNWIKKKFFWQKGFGAFSYSHSDLQRVYKYILNQEKHHNQNSYKQEYLKLLNGFEINYNENYIFND